MAPYCTLTVYEDHLASQVCTYLAYGRTFRAVVSFVSSRTVHNHLHEIQNNLYADKPENREGVVQLE